MVEIKGDSGKERIGEILLSNLTGSSESCKWRRERG